MAPVADASLHTVFTSECNNVQFDWFATGVFESFRASGECPRAWPPRHARVSMQLPPVRTAGMRGKITRLLACSEAQLSTYPKVNLEMGPTFVHKNMRFDASNDAEKDDPHNDGKGTGCASLPPLAPPLL